MMHRQGGYDTLCVVESGLTKLHELDKGIKVFDMNTDSGSGYHTNEFLLGYFTALPSITGIKPRYYIFCEGGEGKTQKVDGHFPNKNRHRRNYMLETKKHTDTPSRMVLAANWNGGVEGTLCFELLYDYSEQIDVKSGAIKGIKSLYVFKLEDNGVRVWKTWGKGPGKLLMLEDLLSKYTVKKKAKSS